MSQQTPERPSWAVRHREILIDSATLLVALNVWPALVRLPAVPFGVQAATLLALVILTPPKIHLVDGLWRRYLRMLPRFLVACAAGIFCLHKFHPEQIRSGWFCAVWLGLTALTRLGDGASHGLRERMRRTRFDVSLGDCALLLLFSFAAPRLLNLPAPNPVLLAGMALSWVVAQSLTLGKSLSLPRDFARNSRVCAFALPLGLLATWAIALRALPFSAVVVAVWLGVALWFFRRIVRAWAYVASDGADSLINLKEVSGWIALSVIVTWELHPLFRPTVYGGGDGLWYATVLMDLITQLRHGVFPVFVGQSIYQFNGAVFPIRIAPGLPFLGAAVDFLTCHVFAPSAVQNLTLALSGFASAVMAYVCARRICGSRLVAWVLAVALISSPGALGVLYINDLFMSWVTLPWVIATLYLAAVSFQREGAKFYALLGFTLAVVWWLHTPIAMWLSVVVTAIQVIRFAVFAFRTGKSTRLAEIAAGAAGFGAIAAYPLVSAIGYPADTRLGSAGGFTVPVYDVTRNIGEAYPKAWLPLSEGARGLSDFQLGYALIALLLAGLIIGWRKMGVRTLAYLLPIAGLLVLLLPIPKLNDAAWSALPPVMLSITNSWPMQRLYLVLSVTVFAAAAILLRRADAHATGSALTLELGVAAGAKTPYWLCGVFVLACAWGVMESSKFTAYILDAPTGPGALTQLAPENAALSRYSYNLFKGRPIYFSHGSIEPAFENRVLTADMSHVVVSNYVTAGEQSSAIGQPVKIGFQPHGAYIAGLRPMILQPGRRFILRLFLEKGAQAEGTLVLKGRTFDRIYGLPATGDAKAFGLGGNHVPYVSVYTSQSTAEEVPLAFIPSHPEAVDALAPLFSVEVQEIDFRKLPIQVSSWLPYRAKVTTTGESWLETPRLFQRAYRATVNSQKATLARSPENLVAVKLPPGENTVEVRYNAPLGMKLSFWLATLTFLGAAVFGFREIRSRTMRAEAV